MMLSPLMGATVYPPLTSGGHRRRVSGWPFDAGDQRLDAEREGFLQTR